MGIDRRLTGKKKRSIRRRRNLKPKIIEDSRRTLIFHTKKTSLILKNTLRDIHILKRENSVYFTKNNDISPFQNVTNVEFLSEKNNTSMFCCGTHTKKRPHNLILGRMYDFKLLDMVELGIEDYEALTTNVKLGNQFGSKPCMLFQGSEFVNSEKHKVLKSLLLDFFKGVEVKKIDLTGIDHAYVITSCGKDILYFRHYSILLKNATEKGAAIGLVDIGPSMTWRIRRDRYASDDLRKLSMRKPQQLMVSKKRNKNIHFNPLGEKIGRIHVKQQPIQQISLRKFIKKKKKKKKKTPGRRM